ncbi:hypothetical protein BTN49_1971 [Candidatus Enterovibrio escicola]|uniref:Uncharacterized protein n=1 Tax=Candidatus Enterovibrio escicola TaxID=1927127 RepID=A0A2A5T2P4_9GAMM|nr:hypothetical protein BTN49_1971 [Candidatus Enterovibrio escacola]
MCILPDGARYSTYGQLLIIQGSNACLLGEEERTTFAN